jgi:cytochrome c oxidase subunit 2
MKTLISYIFPVYDCSYAEKWAVNFQDPASDWMFAIIELHDRIVFYMVILLVVVVWFLVSGLFNKDHMSNLHHGNFMELFWTLSPAGILWAIGLPSLRLLYLMDEVLDATVTVKAIGNQWYWSYEYTDYVDSGITVAFDSFLVDDDSLEPGDLRLLTVDSYLVLPVNTSIRLLVSSTDVIHSFAIPSLALKCDAIPGRLNSTGLIINRPSTYYGQCSELCGVMHGFMPIGLHAVSIPSYLSFLESAKD